MNKTKATPMGKPGDNYPQGATLTNTETTRVGGEMPPTAPLPTMADVLGYMNPASKEPKNGN